MCSSSERSAYVLRSGLIFNVLLHELVACLIFAWRHGGSGAPSFCAALSFAIMQIHVRFYDADLLTCQLELAFLWCLSLIFLLKITFVWCPILTSQLKFLLP